MSSTIYFDLSEMEGLTWDEYLDRLSKKYDIVREARKISTGNKCECGKDKHNFASHSDWCPAHEDKDK